jgi:type VI secretion system secreted protein VgrG
MDKKSFFWVMLSGLFFMGYTQLSELAGLNASKEIKLDSGKKILINAGDEITIKTGSASINLKKDGTVLIKGKDITFDFETANGKADNAMILKGSKINSN